MSIATTIRPEEAAHFGKLAAEWWDPKGSSAMLHRLNPVRLGFIRGAVDAHFHADPRSIRPLLGRTALDVGCGAGLLCEPLARLGATVTGVDAAAENIEAARAHAGPLPITYTNGDIATLGLSGFDLVTSMEVIEHVADKRAFLSALIAALARDTGNGGGLLILSTPNRPAASKWLMIEAAERLGMVPRGTHHWDDFIAPAELALMLEDFGLQVGQPKGIAWNPLKGLHLSDDLALNYILTATWKA
jgi:2-polyprenyl-6-hydroxyphenyl methylase/3-demethylubiquinone-9 3-methyltransferase